MLSRAAAGVSIVLASLLSACSGPPTIRHTDGPSEKDGTEKPDGNGDPGGTPQTPQGPRTTSDGDLIVEGDMLFPGALVKTVEDAVAFDIQRWPDATVPYEIAEDVPSPERIEDAANEWAKLTGIRFVERQSDPSYVRFVNGDACRTFVGMLSGKQTITLPGSCGTSEVMHLLGHTVGMTHPHSRRDRDDFISVHLDNVEDGRANELDKLGFRTLGDYDVGSLMQYGSTFLSKNGQPTITTKTGDLIAAAKSLSPKDITDVRAYYVSELPGPSTPPPMGKSATVSWPKKSNTALYSLDVQLPDGMWVAPCVGAEILERSVWTKFDGTCTSALTPQYDLGNIRTMRICWTEFNDWSRAKCAAKPYAGQATFHIDT